MPYSVQQQKTTLRWLYVMMQGGFKFTGIVCTVSCGKYDFFLALLISTIFIYIVCLGRLNSRTKNNKKQLILFEQGRVNIMAYIKQCYNVLQYMLLISFVYVQSMLYVDWLSSHYEKLISGQIHYSQPLFYIQHHRHYICIIHPVLTCARK